MKSQSSQLGLALSGGGFRATAFHLGVLKRLREVGVLERVEVLSTVSGGSIAGAYWAWWLGVRGATPSDADWDAFERSLVAVMRANLRGRLVRRSVWVPMVVTCAVILASGSALGGILHWWIIAGMAVLGAALAGFGGWIFLSGGLLKRDYDRFLFRGAHLAEVLPARKKGEVPRLFVNATALETAQAVRFTDQERGRDVLLSGARRMPVVNLFTGAIELLGALKERRRLPGSERPALFRTADFAAAVAASSAVPGLFPPVAVGSAMESFVGAVRHRFPERAGKAPRKRSSGEKYLAVDGGVFDNQGLQALVQAGCTRILVSDAAAPLLPAARLPMRRPITLLRRSQEIIYDRVREMGYAYLHEGAAVHQLLQEMEDQGASPQKLAALKKRFGEGIEGFCTIGATGSTEGGLPRRFRSAVAAIRTDLDAFSPIEISALMFHGYTLADGALKEQMKSLIPRKRRTPLDFKPAVPELAIPWTDLESGRRARLLNHLHASTTRLAAWRGVRRWAGLLKIRLSERPRLVALQQRILTLWRTVSPTWEYRQTGQITVTRESGETVVPQYRWVRRRLLRRLWQRLRGAGKE